MFVFNFIFGVIKIITYCFLVISWIILFLIGMVAEAGGAENAAYKLTKWVDPVEEWIKGR